MVEGLRPSGQNHEWKDAFIDALQRRGVVYHACSDAGVSKSTAYEARKRDEAFAAAWDLAIDDFKDIVEAELLRRAVEGVLEPVVSAGKYVTDVRKFSDTMLLAYLNAHAKDRGYNRNARVELSGPDGGPMQHQVLSGLDDHEKQALRDAIDWWEAQQPAEATAA